MSGANNTNTFEDQLKGIVTEILKKEKNISASPTPPASPASSPAPNANANANANSNANANANANATNSVELTDINIIDKLINETIESINKINNEISTINNTITKNTETLENLTSQISSEKNNETIKKLKTEKSKLLTDDENLRKNLYGNNGLYTQLEEKIKYLNELQARKNEINSLSWYSPTNIYNKYKNTKDTIKSSFTEKYKQTYKPNKKKTSKIKMNVSKYHVKKDRDGKPIMQPTKVIYESKNASKLMDIDEQLYRIKKKGKGNPIKDGPKEIIEIDS